MPYKISGYNDIYDGWLARILGQPKANKSNAWVDGWEVADETTPEAWDRYGFQVFKEEIKRGHLIIEEIEMIT